MRYVSVADAQAQYHVVIVDGQIDAERTRVLREQAVAAKPDEFPHFDYGPGRDAFEQSWNVERYDSLTSVLASVPPNWRHFLKQKIFNELETMEKQGTVPASGDVVRLIFENVRKQYAQLQAKAS